MIRDMAIWAIALPEAIWAAMGAVALVGFSQLPPSPAGKGPGWSAFTSGWCLALPSG